MTDIRAFSNSDALFEYLDDGLNQKGIVPEVAGYDNLDRPVIVWLFDLGDEAPPTAVVLGGEDAAHPEIVETRIEDLCYPVTIMLHPDDLAGA